MTIEDQLRDYIIKKYKSIRAFTKAVDLPYSTIDTMLRRGVGGTAVTTVIKVCQTLGLDVNSLETGQIKELVTISPFSPQKQRLIRNYDGLNADGQTKLVDYSDDLVNSGNYKSTPKTSAAPDDLVDIKIAAKGGGVEGRQITREQAEKVKKMLDEIELKDHTGL